MLSLPPHSSDLLFVVFRNSWQSCVLIALIFAVQWVFRKHLTARWRYSLWFLLLVRLAIPSTPQSSFSLFNWVRADVSFAHSNSKPERNTERTPTAGQADAARDGPVSGKANTDVSQPASAPLHLSSPIFLPSNPPRIGWRDKALAVAFWGWVLGIVVLIWRVVVGTHRLSRRVCAVRPITDSGVLGLLEDCKQLMGITTPLVIIETSRIKNPMLYGFLRPRLLLPDGLITRFNHQELRLVLLHELAHLKRGDILVNWLATALQILHWFNPVLWVALARMRADRELACDNLVLTTTQPSEHPIYAATVIKLLEGFAGRVRVPNLLGILETKDEIKQRLVCIANFTRPQPWSAIGVALLLVLALLTLTDGQKASGGLFQSARSAMEVGGTWHRLASGTAQNAPSARIGHSMIWTGKEVIVWGGGSQSVVRNDGGRYDVATDTWRPMALSNAPSPRWLHAAIWTGHEMIVWGGRAQFENLQVKGDGARYNPSTDTWTPLPTKDAPAARSQMAAVWTGKEMLIWGGSGEGWLVEAKGARYNPQANVWQALTEENAPEPRQGPSAVWTGSEMIVWGGVRFSPDQIYFNTGGRYDPARDAWVALPTNGVPTARVGHTAVWTGAEMIVWGGHMDIQYHNTGARFNPAKNTWTPTTLIRAAQRRMSHCAVWTGSEMIVWGGQTSPYDLTWGGGRYSPDADEWRHVTNIGAPAARFFQRDDGAIWTGDGMLIFGGGTGRKEFDSNFLWSPSGGQTLSMGTL